MRESGDSHAAVHGTNVPSDPIWQALTDAAREWASSQDFNQLRSALIGILIMTNRPG